MCVCESDSKVLIAMLDTTGLLHHWLIVCFCTHNAFYRVLFARCMPAIPYSAKILSDEYWSHSHSFIHSLVFSLSGLNVSLIPVQCPQTNSRFLQRSSWYTDPDIFLKILVLGFWWEFFLGMIQKYECFHLHDIFKM